jgi:hypothetical protein
MLSSFHVYRWANGEELYTPKIEPSILGAPIVSFNLSDGSSPRKKKQKKKLGRHLI